VNPYELDVEREENGTRGREKEKLSSARLDPLMDHYRPRKFLHSALIETGEQNCKAESRGKTAL
jgi:hypothetical protein